MSRNFSERDALRLWNQVPATDLMTRDEFAEIFPVFFDALEDTRRGVRLDQSDNFQEFLDLMGLSERTFVWDDFREWYDSL